MDVVYVNTLSFGMHKVSVKVCEGQGEGGSN